MTDYFVAETGSNTSPYETWAKAATSLATALAAATADNDRVIIQYDGVPSADLELGANTTYTFAGNIALIASTNSGTSTITPTPMGAPSSGNWIGNSTTGNRAITFAGAFRVLMYGITLRSASNVANDFSISGSDGCHYELEECRFHHGNTTTTTDIIIGSGATNGNSFMRLKNCIFQFGAVAQSVFLRKHVVLENCTVDSGGSAPTVFLEDLDRCDGIAHFEGCDLSHVTGTLVGDHTLGNKRYTFVNCKFGSGVTVLATQTITNRGSASVEVFDCSSGDQHYHLQYHDAFGALTVDTAIYANDGAQYDGTNYCSWKIVTTANCSYYTPFVSPWFDVYHSGTAAKTPSIEILRDGSATAYQNDEVWGEWAYKGTTGSTQTTLINDRKALEAAAANQDAGVGTSGWTGENATAWSGKLVGASITPAEIGHIRGRACVGEPSITVYVDPQTRLA